MDIKENLLLSLLNLAHYATRNKLDHFSILDAYVVLRDAGVSERMLPDIDYLLPTD